MDGWKVKSDEFGEQIDRGCEGTAISTDHGPGGGALRCYLLTLNDVS